MQRVDNFQQTLTLCLGLIARYRRLSRAQLTPKATPYYKGSVEYGKHIMKKFDRYTNLKEKGPN